MSPLKVLAAGDRFVPCWLLKEELSRESGDDLQISTLELLWPTEPAKRIAEVEEASGSEEQIIEAINDAEIIIVHNAALTKRVIKSSHNLKLIVCTRGGPVNVNMDAAAERRIVVCYAPGRNAPAAAEYTVGLMLAAMRRITEAYASLLLGEWHGEFYAYAECGLEFDGSTAGLVGFGAIGSRVARILRAFGAEVLVYDPFVDEMKVEESGAHKARLEELLEGSQIVSVHARLTDETRGMIGAEQIAHMPEGSVLVNCARGGLLDYEALCDALESEHLGAAALDVYPEEPFPKDSRLLKTPNLVLSPHVAGATKQTARRAARIAAAEVGRYIRGEELANVANRRAVNDNR